MSVHTSGTITKVDEDKRLVFGWASIIKDTDGRILLDRQDDFIDSEDELEKAAYSFVLHSRDGGEMHIRKGVSTMVESVVLSKEKQEALGIPAGHVPVGWWVGFRVNDDRVWQQVKKGDYVGFSVHGTGQRQKASLVDGQFTEIEKGAAVGCDCGCEVVKVDMRLVSTLVKAQNARNEKISRVMREFEAGKLKTSAGKLVTDRRQALAIAMSEARMSKGDYPGHPFRGNQWTGGFPGRGTLAGSRSGGKKKPRKKVSGRNNDTERRGSGAASDRKSSVDAKRLKELQEAAHNAATGPEQEVRLRTPEEVAEFIKHFHEIVTKMKEEGKEAKNFNLCKVTVPGTNLFCGKHKGRTRDTMPQIGGEPLPGTPADKLPKNAKGEVDGTEQYKEALAAAGIEYKATKLPVKDLMASQNELKGPQVASMALSESANLDAPIFVSRDGYVIDGHHRWAALVARDSVDNVLGDLKMNVIQIDMNGSELLEWSDRWAADFGIKPKSAK